MLISGISKATFSRISTTILLNMKFTSPLFLSAILTLPIVGQVLPILDTVIDDIDVTGCSLTQTFDLNDHFGTEEILEEVVRFQSNQTDPATGQPLNIDIALFSERTPITRDNFLNYVNDGDYDGSIIHRSVPGFVIQGGGFTLSENANGLASSSVPTDPPILNEPGVSNTFGTVSMAKLGGDPDSATSQWFVSTGDNSDNLDVQNGGFTVFGRATRSTINNAVLFNSTTDYPLSNFGGALSSTPVIADIGSSLDLSDFILFSSASLVPLPAGQAGDSTTLTYDIVSNSNPALFSILEVAGSEIRIILNPSETGTANLLVRATDSVGNEVTETFSVSKTEVCDTYESWVSTQFTAAELGDPSISGANADPDGDGHTNFVHFATGVDIGDRLVGVVCLEEVTEAGDVNISFPLFNSPNISFTVESTTNLNNPNAWATVPHTESIARVNNGLTETVTATISGADLTTPTFYRVIFSEN